MEGVQSVETAVSEVLPRDCPEPKFRLPDDFDRLMDCQEFLADVRELLTSLGADREMAHVREPMVFPNVLSRASWIQHFTICYL